jgi:hypothetical protein
VSQTGSALVLQFIRSFVVTVISLIVVIAGFPRSTPCIDILEEGAKGKVNQLPVLDSIGNKSTTEGKQLSFVVTATDEESVPVLSAEDLPEGARFIDYGDGTGLFDWTPEWSVEEENTGSYQITFLAADDSGMVAYEKIIVLVNMADSRGWDFAVLGGFSFPQGSFTRYADGGLGLTIRATYHPRPLSAIGFWGDVGYTWFGSSHTTIAYDEPGYWSTADQKITEQAISFHVGGQLGSASQRAFFRPRAAVGPGFYIFYTTNTVTAEDFFGEEEEFGGIDDAFIRFGWKTVLGADFFIKRRYGISFELVYDHIYKLDQPEGLHAPRRTSRFSGVSGGVTFSY